MSKIIFMYGYKVTLHKFFIEFYKCLSEKRLHNFALTSARVKSSDSKSADLFVCILKDNCRASYIVAEMCLNLMIFKRL